MSAAELRDDDEHLAFGAVVDNDSLTAAVRAARATVARLRLQLRAAERDAEDAEHEVATVEAGDSVELARDLFRTVIEPRLAVRQAELDADLAAVRDAAAARIEQARAEAEDMVEAARRNLIHQLFDNRPTVAEPSTRRFHIVERPPVVEPAAPVAEAIAGTEWVEAAAPPVERARILLPPPATPPARAASKPKPLRRFLYTDVILPMIAALSVIIVLLAWFR